jgi:hypothetical protein
MMRKNHGIMKPIPIEELEGASMTKDEVEEFLKKHKKSAYTIQRIMIDRYDRKEEDILGSFSQWKPGDPALYTRISRALKALEEEGKVSKKKYSKAVVYWWKE